MFKDGNLIKGISTDIKPTETDPIEAKGFPVREGDMFFEADTGNVSTFLNGEWVEKE